MSDTLGWRAVFGVVTPSTNTIVQPEYDALRPPGVTNHHEGMPVSDMAVEDDADFDLMIERIDFALEDAVDRALTCKPDALIVGAQAVSIWGDGLATARSIEERMQARAERPIPVTQVTEALPVALRTLGVERRIALVTPYFPVAGEHLSRFCDQIGFTPVRMLHLSCKSSVQAARISLQQLQEAVAAVDNPDVEAIVGFGANLPMARIAAEAERKLAKPVIAGNTATYWHALRTFGIAEKRAGCGRLFAEF